ncbi:oligosaccharide repeat unit polymerase [Pedobacter chitinilyticus]|uniref:Oligosaccharide repeat unit polymerase n=1 Tax=Pedobacter chitinilyticus TaxID=2233776 RepID=A0A3S3PSU3_9SPHI|nr:oligosaccharide repeat unit polymerase [Pedobacter chitinilyticus]RWU05464.1 oligosaccharide repeat unit polymerase [Pedobacter chitinilyticus]
MILEEMVQKNYSLSYSKLILIGLAFLYFIVPSFIEDIVGADFYIYSKFQNLVSRYSISFFFMLVVFLWLLLSVFPERKFKVPPVSSKVLKVIFFLNCLYQLFLISQGVLARLSGFSRNELLDRIGSLLIPGYGYILLLACISILKLRRRKFLVIFFCLSFTIDILYQGKIFATVSLMLLMFYLDISQIKLTTKRIVILIIFGFTFLISVILLRSTNEVNSDTLLDIYTSFSEFMGVQATVGWGYEYSLNQKPIDLFKFDTTLQDYYFSSVGHGLALSPASYFLGNFGGNYYLIVSIYFVLLFILYVLAARLIGHYSIFILMFNYIHLIRHGPSIFLFNSIFQIIFLILITLFLKLVNEEKYKLFNQEDKIL